MIGPTGPTGPIILPTGPVAPEIIKPSVPIDFMLIVLNGEPFIEAWLKTYEPHANKIFIIEGTDSEFFKNVPKDIRKLCHTGDGHSIDKTREVIQSFNSNKIVFIDKNPQTGNGFWDSKDQMIKQINSKVESEWVWEADCDEFLHQDNIVAIKDILNENRNQLVWQFKVWNFWRSISHVLCGGWVSPYRRIFRWGPGKTKFVGHRPPTTNMDGAPRTLPFPLYHYNYILDIQARYKPLYHRNCGPNWYENKWKAWSPKNKDEIEKGGIGPLGWGHTVTKKVKIQHPEFVVPVIQRLIENGEVFA